MSSPSSSQGGVCRRGWHVQRDHPRPRLEDAAGRRRGPQLSGGNSVPLLPSHRNHPGRSESPADILGGRFFLCCWSFLAAAPSESQLRLSTESLHWVTASLCCLTQTPQPVRSVQGSTDCICFATVGTNDPVTSALHIIVGESRRIRFCFLGPEQVAHGYFWFLKWTNWNGHFLSIPPAGNTSNSTNDFIHALIPHHLPATVLVPGAQETLSRWTCARCTTTTPSCDTRSPCWATVSTATCWATARGRGGWDRPDTTSRVLDWAVESQLLIWSVEIILNY